MGVRQAKDPSRATWWRSPRLRLDRAVARTVPFFPGDYIASTHELYRVEKLSGDRVLLEDCRNGSLFDLGLHQLAGLRLVKRAHGACDASGRPEPNRTPPGADDRAPA